MSSDMSPQEKSMQDEINYLRKSLSKANQEVGALKAQIFFLESGKHLSSEADWVEFDNFEGCGIRGKGIIAHKPKADEGGDHPKEGVKYAVQFHDNSSGDSTMSVLFARYKNGYWFDERGIRPLSTYIGDKNKVIKYWPLSEEAGLS